MIDGCLLQAGERVLLANGSGGHDDSALPDPWTVRLDRTPNKHLGFGRGTHRCVGMHMAREEFMIVMRHILERMPDCRLTADEIGPYPDQGNVAGWLALPAAFTSGPRVGASVHRGP